MYQRRKRVTRVPLSLASREDIEEAKKFASAACQKLALRGVPIKALNVFMLQVMFRQAASKRTDWDRPRAMPWYTLRKLPERIRTLAREIEAVNSDSMLEPVHLLFPERESTPRDLRQELHSDAPERAKLAYKFRDLPRTMREFTVFIDFVLDVIGKRRRHPYNPLHHCFVAFVHFVYESTHNFMYKDIAALASAVMAMAGSQSPLNPVNLAKLYRNNPHLHSDIAFE
jgi:hypothetical protein